MNSSTRVVVVIFAIIIIVGAVALLRLGAPGAQDYKNATYEINGQAVALVDGYAEAPAAPGSASKVVTRYFGNEAMGDLNGDGVPDVAFVLTQETGGSGTFYYAVAALDTQSGWKGTNAVLLGDRIAPQSTNIMEGKITVNYADRRPGEPMTASPSIGVTKYLEVKDGQLVEDPLPQIYSNGSEGFSIRLPAGYTPDASYTYQELGPGKDIKGVKFTIPSSLTSGTNLSDDTYLSVEEIPSTAVPPPECSAARFLADKVTATTITDKGVTYSIASSTGAGAGNRYEETVYALSGTNPCVAVRYFIHYGVIENYPAGAVREFDQAALLAEFDAIRRTLTVAQ